MANRIREGGAARIEPAQLEEELRELVQQAEAAAAQFRARADEIAQAPVAAQAALREDVQVQAVQAMAALLHGAEAAAAQFRARADEIAQAPVAAQAALREDVQIQAVQAMAALLHGFEARLLPISEQFRRSLAAEKSDEAIIEELRKFVATGGNVEEIYAVPNLDWHPLTASLMQGKVALAEALITEFSCPPQATDSSEVGAILAIVYSAEEFDKADAIRRMIICGASLDQKTLGKTPFMMLLGMLEQLGEQVVDPFLEEGNRAHLSILDDEGDSVLHYATRHATDAFLARLLTLQEIKDLLHLTNGDGFTPLQEAVRLAKVDKANLLITTGAKTDVLGPNGETLLDLAKQDVDGVDPQDKERMVARVTELMQAPQEEQKEPQGAK